MRHILIGVIMMHFLLVIRNICRGIYKGIHNEVKKLADISSINSLLQERKNEVKKAYEELGEYVYHAKTQVNEDYVQRLCKVLHDLHEEIDEYEAKLAQLKDG